MRHEMKKIGRIIDEFITTLLIEDTNELDIKIKTSAEETYIHIVDYNTHYTEGEVQRLDQLLNEQRQHEIEEYYWQLAGETDEGDELVLLSAMVDRAIVEIIDGNLDIELFRKHN
ncbi:hypothetical protein QBE53_02575 [Vallitaleaceae bacterium 9-2]